MKQHRSGHQVTVCDGCYKIVKDKQPQILNADGTPLDCCGLDKCNAKIRAKHDPPYMCPDCVTLNRDECPPEHRRERGPDRDTGEKMDEATIHQDVIY